MLHAGLDLSRRKLDICLLSDQGEHLDQLVVAPDADALKTLARRIAETHQEPVSAVIESMTGARSVHDTLEQEGWDVEIADAQKVKGLAPLACKTDRIDSKVLATLSQRDLVPAIWLPDPRVREQRELARFRLHLVKHKSALKNRIHSTLINFGRPCPVSDLFGVEGRKLLERLEVPEPWRANVTASVELIDELEHQIDQVNRRLKADHADHPYIPLLMSAPGIGWVLAFTIASEIGEIERFASPQKLAGYTGLCPRVNQSGDPDRRGPLTKSGPRYLRWAMLEATMHASRHPAYSGALSAKQAPPRKAARRQGCPDRHRPPAHPRDLAHAEPKRELRSPRRHFSSGGIDRPFGLAPASESIPFRLILPERRGHRDMSTAPHPKTSRGP
ncbi:MAG: IS110 family transposase [Actinomycetota bacterium]|nr:IS110 family transposase [Actinomycetota bacterium]